MNTLEDVHRLFSSERGIKCSVMSNILAYNLSGSLDFVDLDHYNTNHLPHGDDTYKSVSIEEGFTIQIGCTTVYYVNVCHEYKAVNNIGQCT